MRVLLHEGGELGMELENGEGWAYYLTGTLNKDGDPGETYEGWCVSVDSEEFSEIVQDLYAIIKERDGGDS